MLCRSNTPLPREVPRRHWPLSFARHGVCTLRCIVPQCYSYRLPVCNVSSCFCTLSARQPPPPRTISSSLLTVLFLRSRSRIQIFLTWVAGKPPMLDDVMSCVNLLFGDARVSVRARTRGLGSDAVHPPRNELTSVFVAILPFRPLPRRLKTQAHARSRDPCLIPR